MAGEPQRSSELSTTYGSDVAIAALAALGIDHVAFNPGASFRGLHESMVHAGAQRPVLCLSEGVAVAVAHGYAKATGRPMAVFLHNLVGLQSGSMGIFNAWLDQAPMLVVGGSGPADTARRRPWIDWIHTAHPQGGLVRDFVKWDDEPASVAALVESLAHAHRVATTAPSGPVYVALDALLQESPAAPLDLTDGLSAAATGPSFTMPPADLERLAGALLRARAPVLLADYVGRSADGYHALGELARLTGARVVDLGGRHNFPNTDPHDGTDRRGELLATADVVLALDVRDLSWAVSDVDAADRTSRTLVRPDAEIYSVGLGDVLQRGFLRREGTIAHRHTSMLADTAVALPQLVEIIRATAPDRAPEPARDSATNGRSSIAKGEITDDVLAAAVFDAVRTGPWQLAHGALHGAARRHWHFDRFNCHLGGSGGAGLGYGVGATIGAGLAARSTDTLVVALQPDGDLLYTASGLWTAAHEQLSMLVVVVNNRTYAQDRMHQTLMSRTRGRPPEHIPIGIDIDDPEIDFATLAQAQGVEAFGPVTDATGLGDVLARATRAARDEHRPVLVDVHVGR